MRSRYFLILIVLGIGLGALQTPAKEVQRQDAMGRDYWLYTPDEIDPEKTYTLVVGVHGARGNGKGAAGHANWVNQHDVIVVGPSYLNDEGAFQYLGGNTDKQTIDLFKTLSKEFKLHDKLFIAGFSGGSQYAHRFAMKYPDLVAGCAAHSGGTWATGDYPKGEAPNPKARGVIFVISCGENDTKKSFPQAPLGRLEWAKKYEGMLKDGGFIYEARWWPGVGHHYARGARQMTADCFVASTQLMPAFQKEAKAIDQALRKKQTDQAWAMIRQRQQEAASAEQGIIKRVTELYLESLSAEVRKIDRLAEREVRLAVRDHDEPGPGRAALLALKDKYAGLPETTEAIEKALSQLDAG